MNYKIDDKRKGKSPTVKSLIDSKKASIEDVKYWLRTICEIRYFEEKVFDLLGKNIIKGASHLYAGEEAVATGCIAAMAEGDVIGSTHRGHGHCGAIGNKYATADDEHQTHWNRMMAELMGRETGYCNGRGGSMHIADVKIGNLGSTGIVGGNQPPAVGAALAEKYKGTGKAVLSFFGDGATNTGSFHESMNLASVLHVPLVAIIENNLYGMSVPFSGSPVEGTTRAANLEDSAQRAAAYNVPAMIIDGQDVVAVFLAMQEAIEYARKNNKLMIVEAKTYRWYGHSRSDPRAYRTKEEEQQWRDRDPILVLSKKLIDEGLATQEDIDKIKKAAEDTIEKATQFGIDSPWPDPKDLERDVYVTETYENSDIELDKKNAAKALKATDAFNEYKAADSARTQKEKNENSKARIKEEFGMDILSIGEALVKAQSEELRRDKNVIILGEDIGLYGGAYGATKGMIKEFGEQRIIDTPISEAAITGSAVGAAIRGLRPVAEIMYVDFITIAMDQLMHNGAFNRYMFGGHAKVPMVLRTEGGVGRCIAAHHSKSLEAWLMHVPGLHVVMPSTPYDAYGLLKSAIRSDNPVVFIEHKATYGQTGAVPAEEYIIPIGKADIKREGSDITITAYSRQVMFALEAAKQLEKQGISAEVIDLRTLKPLDIDCVAASVRKTGRLINVAEGFTMCGSGAEIVRRLFEYKYDNGRSGFDYLDAPPVNMAAKDVPPPMSEPLELASIPSVETIVAQAVSTVKGV
jgi:2-oxoisovalerate dehydrogenase E1 component